MFLYCVSNARDHSIWLYSLVVLGSFLWHRVQCRLCAHGITYHRHFVTNVSNSVLFSMLFVVFFSVTTRILRRSLDIVSRYKVSFYYQVDLIQSCLPRPRRVDAFTMMTVVWRLSVCPVSEPMSRMEAHIKLVIGRK